MPCRRRTEAGARIGKNARHQPVALRRLPPACLHDDMNSDSVRACQHDEDIASARAPPWPASAPERAGQPGEKRIEQALHRQRPGGEVPERRIGRPPRLQEEHHRRQADGDRPARRLRLRHDLRRRSAGRAASPGSRPERCAANRRPPEPGRLTLQAGALALARMGIGKDEAGQHEEEDDRRVAARHQARQEIPTGLRPGGLRLARHGRPRLRPPRRSAGWSGGQRRAILRPGHAPPSDLAAPTR